MSVILSKIVSIFLITGVGFAANRKGILPYASNKYLVDLMMLITCPCMIISTIREFLAYGSFYGIKLISFAPLPMARNSFGGFLVIAILCALWSELIRNYKYKVEVEATYSERIDEDNI